LKIDVLVKSQKTGRSRGCGSPELMDLTGFPLSGNDEFYGISFSHENNRIHLKKGSG
jgi:hypothetical protein